jgi:hypothetical protein
LQRIDAARGFSKSRLNFRRGAPAKYIKINELQKMPVKYLFWGPRRRMPVKSFKRQKNSCANFQGSPRKEIKRASAFARPVPCRVKQYRDEKKVFDAAMTF